MAGTCDLLRGRKKIFLAKVEVTENVDSLPTPALNAILVNAVDAQPQANLLAANELTGRLDLGEFDIGGFPIKLPIQVNLKPGPDGSTAPEAGVLLAACGIAAVADTEILGVATGGTTKTVTVNRSVNTGFPATDGALVGRGIVIGFAPNHAVALITSYVVVGSTVTIGLGKTLDVAPTNQEVEIPEGISYKPSEACPPTLTCYLYEDGVLKKYTGCRGTASWSVNAGGRPEMTIDLTGFFLSKADVALPIGSVVYQDVRPGIWRGGLMTIDAKRAAVEQMTVALNNTYPYPGDPNEQEGFLPPVITSRDIQGNVNPFETLVATRDIFTDFRNGVKRAIAALIPAADGNSHYTGFTFPTAKYRSEGPADRNGLIAVNAPFSALNDADEHPEKGDSSFVLTFFYEPLGS